MPNKFEPYQSLVNDFNAKYGLNFSYEAFELGVRRSQYMNENFVSEKGDPNDRAYVNKFGPLYRQALTNFADRKIDSFNTEEMIREYKKVMNGYKQAVNQDGIKITAWPKDSYLVSSAKKELNKPGDKMPDDKVDFISQRYLAGKLPIREMRAHVNQLQNCKDPKKLSAALAYAYALEEVNSRRSKVWRFFHRFRNAAEKREAKNFKKLIHANLEGIFVKDPRLMKAPMEGASNLSSGIKPEFYLARSTVRDNSIGDAKADLDKLEERFNHPVQAKPGEKTQNNNEKIPLNINPSELEKQPTQLVSEQVQQKEVPVIDQVKKP